MPTQFDRTHPLPRVSIGMPVYNGERWLDETLRALRAQTLPEFELVVSDNASTDATAAICARHARQDGRIRYYRNARNIGANGNYMAVLARARAGYFKWASSHDLCAPQFLERCVAALEAEPGAVLAYPRTMLFAERLEEAVPYERDIPAMQESAAARFTHILCNMKFVNPMNGVIRTDMLRRAHSMGSFASSDRVMLAELALLGKFVLIPERLFFYRIGAEASLHMRPGVEQAQHYDPDATGPRHWQHWKFQWRLLRAAAVSAPPGSERAAAVVFALKCMVWGRSRLMRDVVAAMGFGR